MHVVIATGLYSPEIGGPATFSVLFEKGLSKHNIPYTTIPFSTVRHLPKLIRHVVYFSKVLSVIRKDSIVLALDPVSVGLPALLAARLRSAPFYLRVGGDYAWEQAIQRWGFEGLPEEFPGSARLPLAGRLLVWIERYVAQRAKRILTQSGHLASIVARWDVPRERIAVVPNGVELPALPSREEAKKGFGFGDEPIVVSAGRFVPWKGFLALIEAFHAVQGKFPTARLVLAGDGPQVQELKESAKDFERTVVFTGSLPKKELFALLRAADVFVLNTRYEGFSHQILEALAVGIPVVTTNIPGNTELAESGMTALTVEWNDERAIADAIKQVLEDKKLAGRVAEGGKRHAASFTPERTFKDTCKALGIDL